MKNILYGICLMVLSGLVMAMGHSSTTAVKGGEFESSAHVVGGWYPVFFDDYSAVKVNQIITSIKEGRVSKISINYDQNQALADNIHQTIISKTNVDAKLVRTSPPQDNTVKYNHMRVVVTVWSK